MFSVIANWKSHKNLVSCRAWVNDFLEAVDQSFPQALTEKRLELIICPPAPLLYPLKQLLSPYEISIGAQDVSPLPEGKYTGQISAESLAGIASHVVLGHIEQRSQGDSQEKVREKFGRAISQKMIPLLCVTTPSQLIASSPYIVFEPPSAVGTDNAADIEEVKQFKSSCTLDTQQKFIYGGSVGPDNIEEYMKSRIVDGVFVGADSLDPLIFAQLINLVITHA